MSSEQNDFYYEDLFDKNDDNHLKSDDFYGQGKSYSNEEKSHNSNNRLNNDNNNAIVIQQNNDNNVQPPNQENAQHSNNNPQLLNNNNNQFQHNRIADFPNEVNVGPFNIINVPPLNNNISNIQPSNQENAQYSNNNPQLLIYSNNQLQHNRIADFPNKGNVEPFNIINIPPLNNNISNIQPSNQENDQHSNNNPQPLIYSNNQLQHNRIADFPNEGNVEPFNIINIPPLNNNIQLIKDVQTPKHKDGQPYNNNTPLLNNIKAQIPYNINVHNISSPIYVNAQNPNNTNSGLYNNAQHSRYSYDQHPINYSIKISNQYLKNSGKL